MSGGVRGVGVLPVEVTGFVGRRGEVRQVRQLLSGGRLVTLTGAGGIGKTRLALRSAAEVGRAFPDGVCLVELAALSEGRLLAQTVVDAVGLREQSSLAPLEILRGYLAERKVLLVLDNCEHLIDACGALVSALLQACPGLNVLATSRQVLGVAGESVVPVPPLALPAPDCAPQAAAQSEAVSLFMQRAASARAGFAVSEDRMGVVAEICRRLDGIPLAIELAAARVRALSVEEILHRLDDRFALLTGGSRAALPRQRTLRAAIDWSYGMCSEPERLLWERLSVFSGSFDLQAAEAVCCGEGIERGAVFDLVAGLVDKSVVGCEESGGRMRYRLLETLRQYGQDLLAASGRQPALRRRHRDWYQHLVKQGETDWFGPDDLDWLAWLRVERPNLRAALEYSLDEPGQVTAAMEMAGCLWAPWYSVGALSEARGWLERALALEVEDSPERAKALWVLGWFTREGGDTTEALRLLAECREAAERLDDRSALAWATQFTAAATLSTGDIEGGLALATEGLQRQRALGDYGGMLISLIILAMVLSLLGDPRALEYGEEAVALCEEKGSTWGKSYALWGVGLEMVRRGNTRRATTLLREGLRFGRAAGDHLACVYCAELLAWIAAQEGEHEQAARLLGAVNLMRHTAPQTSDHNHRVPLNSAPFLAEHDRCEASVRGALGEAAFQAAFASGAELSVEDAYAFALGEKAPAAGPGPVASAAQEAVPLTRREREVAALIAQGLSNKQIATKLVISPRTAEGHVEHILVKLGFTSRAQIAAWTTQQPH
ncbi:putative ATPase [Streptomyces sp. SLBN-118]|uniref:LuxR C-terminal-related transcriptional regulator n=1 Tax=Streptomyces sp. SLBN-118 TaxID=2768454 RepID=UPI001153A83A|nr:LuxR C-terminal-related transcriptional regulator [Streptomyces sp. SLBN-118]TQK50750.1 putative ATPase [Streptomyces sp. SLBN-118]